MGTIISLGKCCSYSTTFICGRLLAKLSHLALPLRTHHIAPWLKLEFSSARRDLQSGIASLFLLKSFPLLAVTHGAVIKEGMGWEKGRAAPHTPF